MEIVRVLRRGEKNSRVKLIDGSERLVSNDLIVTGDWNEPSVLKAQHVVEETQQQSVQERFAHLEKLVGMVILGQSPSLIICGDAGIGKTYIVRQQLKGAGLVEQVISADAVETDKKSSKKKFQRELPYPRRQENSYLFVKGYSSPMGLYQVLHNNRSATIVFDDCDSVFKAAVSVNILKSALDSYDRRVVSWVSPAAAKMGLESSFEFKGKIIFLSNLSEADLDGAVKSRSFLVDIHLSRKEIWERMQGLLVDIEPGVSIDVKTEVLNYIGINYERFREFNLRTLIKAIRIRQSDAPMWKEMILNFA